MLKSERIRAPSQSESVERKTSHQDSNVSDEALELELLVVCIAVEDEDKEDSEAENNDVEEEDDEEGKNDGGEDEATGNSKRV